MIRALANAVSELLLNLDNPHKEVVDNKISELRSAHNNYLNFNSDFRDHCYSIAKNVIDTVYGEIDNLDSIDDIQYRIQTCLDDTLDCDEYVINEDNAIMVALNSEYAAEGFTNGIVEVTNEIPFNEISEAAIQVHVNRIFGDNIGHCDTKEEWIEAAEEFLASEDDE